MVDVQKPFAKKHRAGSFKLDLVKGGIRGGDWWLGDWKVGDVEMYPRSSASRKGNKIDGEDMMSLRGAKREYVLKNFGMLFQSAALFDLLTVWENVAFGLIEGAGMDKEQARIIALEKLSKVGLGEAMADADPAGLSGGMRKRVGLARAIATEPDIIFFDEPTTGLDPIMGDVINNLITECVRDLGATTLTISHDMSSARTIADRVAMLYEGGIIWTGGVDQIDHCSNDFVDQFIHGREHGPFALATT